MQKEELVTAMKRIVALTREQKWDEAYARYHELVARPDFTELKAEDQRKVLEMMVLQNTKQLPNKLSQIILDAHRAALPALTELVSVHGEPSDHELLGLAHQRLGNEEAASNIYKAGLAIERQRNAASDLCGRLMNRMAAL
ncbi:MAG: hypothetical protein HYV09_04050 [Deltaproteobacteria bacterium]|nr:hypothetical protein [Deltaproteobacteria bacterium]